MDDERLMECVRKYPVIYDMSHYKYLDNRYKTSVWKLISEEIGQSEDACKKRWGNIRDQFKKNLNKRKTVSGQGATNLKKYRYEEILNFLLPHVDDREQIESVEAENEPVETEPAQSAQAARFNETAQPRAILQPIDAAPLNSEPNPPSTAQSTRPVKNRNRRLIMPQSQPSASNTLMEYIIKNNERSQTDPIDAFFNGIAATKKFSPYYQHLAKGRIFRVVQDLEWEQLSAEPSTYTSPMSGTSSNNISTPVYAPLPTPTPPTPTPSTPTPPTPTPPPSTATISQFSPADQPILRTYFSQFSDENNNDYE